MSAVLQIAIVVSCALLFVYTIYLVKRKQLLLRYSLLWLAIALGVLVFAIFPQPLFRLASLCGFTNASNFIFFCAALVLMCVSLNLSSIVSRQSVSISRLTQKIALLEHEIERSGTDIR